MNFEYPENYSWLKSRVIYLTRAGSHAYGTNTATSDEDFRGVAIAPVASYLGIGKPFEQYEQKGNPDIVIYDFRKFVKLASQANPNILEILFTDYADEPGGLSWTANKLGTELLKMGPLFVTKRARATFSGYATAQLKKIKHNTDHRIPGSDRANRIEEYGYCTKNAMHLVRLLRMCREILETGIVRVKRPDAEELLAIRNGKWTLKELCEYAENENRELDEVCRKSPLPDEPDMVEIDRRCVEIMQEGLRVL